MIEKNQSIRVLYKKNLYMYKILNWTFVKFCPIENYLFMSVLRTTNLWFV